MLRQRGPPGALLWLALPLPLSLQLERSNPERSARGTLNPERSNPERSARVFCKGRDLRRQGARQDGRPAAYAPSLDS